MMLKKSNFYLQENISSKDFLAELLNSKYNIQNYEIDYNEFGKPYLKDIPNLFFNISNKNNITVCAFSDTEIGIDIEQLCYKENVAERVCNQKELKIIAEAQNKELAFTKIWILKESYLKMLGQGLSYGMNNVDTTEFLDKVEIIEYENYLIAICNKDNFK